MAIRKKLAELKGESEIPELADRFSTMRALPGERERKAKRLEFFTDHLDRGTFVSPSWSQVFVKGDPEPYRCDGQHTSTALAEWLKKHPVPPDLTVTITTYEIDDLQTDAPMLFDIFDNPASTRRDPDAMGQYVAGHAEIKPLNNAFLVRAAKGIDEYMKDVPLKAGQVRIRHRTRQHGLYFQEQANRDFVLWLTQWNGTLNEWVLQKHPVVAEMRSDYGISPDGATEFWGHVLREDHPDVDHETRILARDLVTFRNEKKKRLTPSAWRGVASKQWKKWRRLRQLEEKAALANAAPVQRNLETVTT